MVIERHPSHGGKRDEENQPDKAHRRAFPYLYSALSKFDKRTSRTRNTGMPIKTVWLGLNFEDAALNHTEESYASENYAVELCAREQAHLSVFLAAPVFKIPGVIPGAGLIPSWNAPVDEVNANRRAHAEEAQRRIASAVKSAGVTTEFHITQESYPRLRASLIA